MTSMLRWGALWGLIALLVGWSAPRIGAAQPIWQAADAAFYTLWVRADGPVAAQQAGRSWLWGPEPFAVANEPWAETASGTRLVQYFDKARMEVTNPQLDPGNTYYISNGLIVVEMVRGQYQTGEATFAPALTRANTITGTPLYMSPETACSPRASSRVRRGRQRAPLGRRERERHECRRRRLRSSANDHPHRRLTVAFTSANGAQPARMDD